MRFNYPPNSQELTGFEENTAFNIGICQSRCLPLDPSKGPSQWLALPPSQKCGTRGHRGTCPWKQSGWSSWVRGTLSRQNCRFIYSGFLCSREMYGMPTMCWASTILVLGETKGAGQARSILEHRTLWSQGDKANKQGKYQKVRWVAQSI